MNFGTSKFALLISVLFSITLIGCGTDNEPELDTYSIEEVAVLGIETISTKNDSTITENDDALFSSIGEIAVSDEGTLYVLDSDLNKIVLFNSDNEVERVISGKEGRGPGEFVMPTTMALDPSNQDILVYDYPMQRISFFDSKGQYRTTMNVPVRSKSIAVTKDHIWLTNLGSRTYHTAYINKRANEATVNDTIRVSEEDLNHSPNGVASWVGRSSSGSPVVAPPRPGIWFTVKDGELIKRGKELVPNAEPQKVDNIWVKPTQTLGITSFDSNKIGIAWKKRDMESPSASVENIRIDIFTESGKRTGVIPVPFKWIYDFAFDSYGTFLYLAVDDPYPRIIKYKLHLE